MNIVQFMMDNVLSITSYNYAKSGPSKTLSILPKKYPIILDKKLSKDIQSMPSDPTPQYLQS